MYVESCSNEDILRYAEKSGCDCDGDIIQYNGKRYYVDIRQGIVEEVK